MSPWSSWTSCLNWVTSSCSCRKARPSRKLRNARKRSGKVAAMLNVPLSTTKTSSAGMPEPNVSTGTDRSGSSSLLGRVLGRPGPACREELLEPARNGLRHELGDVAAERRDLLDAARRDEAHLWARHHVHRLDVRREVAVELVHLELPLEVRDDAEALDDRLRVPPAREVDDELAEDVDLDVAEAGEGVAEELDPLLDGEHRLLVLRRPHHADDDAVEEPGRARDHVDVAVRDGVVRAGRDRRDHGATSKSVTRVWPYFRLVRTGSGSSGSVRASVSTTRKPSAVRSRGRWRARRGWISVSMP